VTIFLIVEIPMAIYLIFTAVLKLFKSDLFSIFLHIAVQLLNLAVLLSYPINFFIYCRMSRSFRDAFTRLLCPTLAETRQDRLQSIATPLLVKPANQPTNHMEVTTIINTNNKKMSTKDPNSESSSEIYNAATNQLPMTCLSLTTPPNGITMNKTSSGSLAKPRVSFSENLSPTKFTDL
jgi:hypothetical protein